MPKKKTSADERRQATVTFEPDLWQQLKTASEESGMSVAEIVRKVVDIYFDKWLEAHEPGWKIARETLARQGVSLPGSSLAERRETTAARALHKRKS